MMRYIWKLLILLILVACSPIQGSPTLERPTETPKDLAETSGPTPALTSPIPVTAAGTLTASSETLLPPVDSPSISEPVITQMPDAGAVEWRVVVSELENPVLVTSAGDGSGRLFVVEKVGIIRVIQNGDLLTTPFLDIRDRVGSRSSEQGLLGLAFHPGYAENGRFFLNYTDTSGDTIIARYLVSAVDANQAEPSSETRLLKIDQPYANHNGGVVAFGKDGYLYLGLGDGGSAGDPQNLAQSLQTLLGKILRIDVDSDEPYAVPPENSFSPGQLAEIWAYGLRNPWRFSFDRVTGDLFMGDVGQNQWEEINFLPAGSPAGANFGWKYNEGTHPYSPDTPPAEIQLTPPVFEYSHALGCSVTGGVVYRGEKLPDWNGVYLFSDFCSGTIWGLFQDAQGQWVDQVLFTNQGQISSFGEDDQGEVYVIDYNGRILRLERK